MALILHLNSVGKINGLVDVVVKYHGTADVFYNLFFFFISVYMYRRLVVGNRFFNIY